MSNESKTTEDKLREIFINPVASAQVAEMLVTNKPHGWSRKSQSPYYADKYGMELKAALDIMMREKQDVVYSFEKFPGLALNTLYLRVNQSSLYVKEQMDADRKYTNFLTQIDIRKIKGVGVRLSFKEEYRDTYDPASHFVMVKPEAKVPEWKEALDDYLVNGAVGKPFIREGLVLTTDSIAQIKTELGGVTGLICSVTAHTIKVMKTNHRRES